ncbi:hypothetical protein FLA_3235 [Filimonas lacunae]|nr:hypothetical protein FLA_3235 [Filimonas lacunae]
MFLLCNGYLYVFEKADALVKNVEAKQTGGNECDSEHI